MMEVGRMNMLGFLVIPSGLLSIIISPLCETHTYTHTYRWHGNFGEKKTPKNEYISKYKIAI
jgi:hypothetical protein